MRSLLLVLIITCLLRSTNQTLSRADRKLRVPKEETCTPGDPLCDKSSQAPLSLDTTVVDRHLVREHVTYQSVLSNHKAYSRAHADTKSTTMATTLVFVTPWNTKGYETSVTFAKKFSHVSPTWLKVSPDGNLIGRTEVKKKWLKKLSRANPDIKVVPRLIFEQWGPQHFNTFLSNQDSWPRLIDDVTSLLSEHSMHGIVLEIWKQMPADLFSLFLDFLRVLSERFRTEDLYLSLVVPPTHPDPEAVDETPYNSSHFSLTGPLLDSVVLTTYDFPLLSKRPGPSAPLPWVQACVEMLSPNYEMRHKVLMGANMYGYEFSREGLLPLLGPQYLDRLRKLKPEIRWNEQMGEHLIQIDHSSEPKLISYPTLLSIQARIQLADRLSVGMALWEVGQGLDYFYDLF